jgi:hypothetical protein
MDQTMGQAYYTVEENSGNNLTVEIMGRIK